MKSFQQSILSIALVILVSVLNYGKLNAQDNLKGKLELGAFLGASNYQGDINKNSVFYFKEGNFAAGLNLRYYMSDVFALRGNLLYGKITGDDANFEDRVTRGFNFSSPILEFSVQGEYEPLGHKRAARLFDLSVKRIVSPYFFAGVGVGNFNPETDFSKNQLGDSNGYIEQDLAADWAKTRLVVPLGAGLKFDLNTKWSLGLELGMRVPFTDYIDGVSLSGNPDKDDWYVFGGLTASYRFGQYKIMDKDGDGVSDSNDKCPDVAGTKGSDGCPEMVPVSVEDAKILSDAIYGVQFETAKYTFMPESMPILDNIVSVLNKYRGHSLRISGHTDNVGDDASNLILSNQRAKACFDYLVSKGIAPNRLSFQGYGESRPIADNATEEGRSKNRRVEFDLTPTK